MNLQITNEDCMELMRRTPDGYYNLAIVDPPYGIGDFRNRGKNKGEYNHLPKSEHRFSAVGWNDSIPTKEYFDELYRVSKNQIIWGCEYYGGMIPFSGRLVWDKKQPLHTLSQADIAAVSMQGRVTIWRYLWAGVARERASKYDTNRIHPCEKPVALYKHCLQNYAAPGDRILDTHGGSLSIAIACYDLGFDLTACELDPDYYAAAMKRITTHIRTHTMGEDLRPKQVVLNQQQLLF